MRCWFMRRSLTPQLVLVIYYALLDYFKIRQKPDMQYEKLRNVQGKHGDFAPDYMKTWTLLAILSKFGHLCLKCPSFDSI